VEHLNDTTTDCIHQSVVINGKYITQCEHVMRPSI